ncbi:glycoside hydrolase family 13 protein [Melissococcus plutonius]|uniref:glycoside hydrolase family 13 protein n=1 Tax=Melissococcus plutonius TaxID=33970 RepID=UPI00065E814D|nr:alpha-glucosidase [Melissococcus plutonius]KMT32232.1 putative oligo-1,6-glucosidase 3 [Melissococcus plutonius]
MESKKIWWKETVGYQIYPASFLDTNNDGIGDLNGIRKKLGYLKDLGIGFIWITPIYESPNVDNGYDISDYQKILETFGTMEEFDDLLNEAHEYGIKIIMDLVLNHTSEQHPWFVESRKSEENDYRNYYIWDHGKVDGPPNDWQSIFGGSAWQYDEETNQYYLHVFSKEQPDLNWANEKVQQELFKMIHWWLDKGIDGFRLDAISHIKKAPVETNFTENPLAAFTNVSGIEVYLKALSKVIKKDDILSVGEANGVSAEEATKWVGPKGYFNMLFEFEHLSLWDKKGKEMLDIIKLKKALTRWQEALNGKGWNALYMENHDIPRSVSTFGNDEMVFCKTSAKALATMYFLLQGTPFIYQGQELGMTNMPFESIEEFDAVDTKNFYHEMIQTGIDEKMALSIVRQTARDNSRTPVQWTDEEYAGFSDTRPWIGVNPNKYFINAKEEEEEADSVLNYYKQLIKFRQKNNTLIYGAYQVHYIDHKQLYIYERFLDDERFAIIVNLTGEFVSVDMPKGIKIEDWHLALSNLGDEPIKQHAIFTPYEARVYCNKNHKK